jgi:protease IV
MLKFLKYTLAVITGTFVGLLMFFIVLGIVVVSVVAIAMSEEKSNDIKENSVLVIKLDQPILEKAPTNPFKNFSFLSMAADQTLGLNDILDNIHNAKYDSKIHCILLNIGYIQASYETIEEIRDALIDFKKSGKFIIAYSDYYAQSAYYLSSVANKVYMNPEGILEFRGISSQLIFLKNTFEKLGIKPEPIRHGKYKGAIEMFANDKMSTENREQHQMFVDAVWKHVISEIGESRHIKTSDLNFMADSLLVRNGNLAFKYKLLDSLKYYDQIIAQIKDSLHIAKKDKVPSVQLSDYIESHSKEKEEALNSPTKVAVVIAQGDIMPGMGDDNNIGSEKYSRLFRDLRNDTTVKVIVFRLNTGGGSSLASESIWREVSLTAREKPVVISMGDYCASGGYYVACPGVELLANPLTLTGSIGVYGLLFDASKMLENVGISTDIVKTNKYSDIGTVTRALSPFEEAVIRREVDLTYQKFVEHVSKGRKLSQLFVDSIGQGRIWSGNDALRLRLIDKLGGLTEAIKIASEKAKLGNSYDVAYYPKEESAIDAIMHGFKSKMQEDKINEYFGDYKDYFEAFKQLNKQHGLQMKLPYVLKME